MTLRTEDEAAGTICWRTIGTNAVGTCIASQCAAWRWAYSAHRHPDSGRVVSRTQSERGYCGLAGEPR